MVNIKPTVCTTMTSTRDDDNASLEALVKSYHSDPLYLYPVGLQSVPGGIDRGGGDRSGVPATQNTVKMGINSVFPILMSNICLLYTV